MRILGVIHRGNLRTLLIVAAALLGRPTPWSIGVGTSLVIVGAALHVYAKGCLIQNLVLTTGGPYRFTRNPFYLANFVIDGGLCVIANQPALGLLALGLWVPIYAATIRREERLLAQLFGVTFHRYVARVPRFFPWRRPLPLADAGHGFSFRNRNLAVGREYARMVRILTAPLWIVVPRALWEATQRDFSHAGASLATALLLAALWCLDLGLTRVSARRSRGTATAIAAPL
jgi:protein-S-isoprenylcysteine O-methyltransferase Ste14